MNEKLIEIGELIHKSLLNGSSKTNPALDEAMLLFVCNSLTILKEQEAMVKPTKCPCGDLFDAKDSSFCPKCGCAYGELSGRYTNIGR